MQSSSTTTVASFTLAALDIFIEINRLNQIMKGANKTSLPTMESNGVQKKYNL